MAQQQQKATYDAKHNTNTNIKVGDEVLVKNMKNATRVGGKLDIRWTGPYKVTEDAGKMRYKLKRKKTGRALKQMVHCCRLKHYLHSTDAEVQEEQDNPDLAKEDAENKDDRDKVSYGFNVLISSFIEKKIYGISFSIPFQHLCLIPVLNHFTSYV